LTSDTSQSPTLGPTDKSSMPTGWCSTLSRSDCTMLLTQKGASGSRNYPTHSGGFVAYQANRAVTLLPGLRLQSYPTCRRNMGITDSRAVQ
jgi:hypothetical protein